MKDNRNSDESHDEEEEDAEEAISLSDFPITANNHNNSTTYHQTRPSVPDQETDFFEFFNDDLISEISHADDIILSGKLIPTLNQQKLQHQTSIKPQRTESHRITFREDGNQRNFHKLHHRRWESFSGLKSSSSPSNSPKTGLVRNRTRSLDYQNLPRSCSVKSSIGGRAADHSKVLKHRWYVLMFGSFRFPREMELRDIKNRQVRRGTTPAATMFQPLDGGGKNPVSPIHARKSSWGLLKILACKENVSNDVMPSVCCVPKV
ncbi:hypothetical protein Vadar_005194 [Vaccinium darrowii]|uniref:Uncharacterized protein n=1 Tax=Vaccinium darrowii TaxID=229202 RepID=A0ACB7Z1Q9_9ERIC|nr:hypothetical protein Vadar_005194 [Vaccinium darrowii]